MPDPLHSGLTIPLHSTIRCGSLTTLLGMACSGSVFLLLMIDFTHLGSPMIPRSPTCIELTLAAPDFLQPGSALPSQSVCCLDFVVFSLGMARLGSVSSLSVLDFAHLGLLMFTQSFVHLRSSLLVIDFLHPDLITLLKSSAQPSFVFLIFGVMRCGFGLSMLDFTTLESITSLQAMGHSESPLFVLDFLHSDSTLLLRSFCHPDMVLFSSGMACPGLVFFLSVLDFAHPASSLLVRSFVQSDTFMSVPDSLHLGLLSSSKGSS